MTTPRYIDSSEELIYSLCSNITKAEKGIYDQIK